GGVWGETQHPIGAPPPAPTWGGRRRGLVGGLFEEWCYVPGALAQLKRYLDTGIDAFFADDPGLARRALSGKTPR
ncbi:hypothetical protein, partial [Xanthomonas campestris]|uniref:hypothetical protein n=1 Tax=Xanthomonas campestris TaxID=339 RepID=UPI001E618F2F